MTKVLSGFTSCPACMLMGTPQEPYMALPTDDKRVLCLSCQRITSEIDRGVTVLPTLKSLPAVVRDMVLALISTTSDEDVPTYRVATAFTKGMGFHDPMDSDDLNRCAAAQACKNVDVLLRESERTEILFAHGPAALHTLRLSYLPADLNVAADGSNGVEDQFRPILDRLKHPEVRGFVQLSQFGFKPHMGALDLDSSLRRVLMVRGSGDAGIRAEIVWIAV